MYDTPNSVKAEETNLKLCGETVQPLAEGALFWPSENCLIVADLHFEKGSSYAARGVHLPPYDTSATLSRLDELVARLKPASVIALGDSFHDGEARARIASSDAARIKNLTKTCDWTWIAGNHDPLPEGFGGTIAEEVRRASLTFRHEPAPAPATGEVAGHLHPCAVVRVRGRRLRRRCFASDGTRLILPAFGAYTGGLNVCDVAYNHLFAGRDFHAWMMGRDKVVPVAASRLVADRML